MERTEIAKIASQMKSKEDLLSLLNRIKRAGFRPESYTLFVYGTCARCHNRQTKAKKQESKTNKRNIEK